MGILTGRKNRRVKKGWNPKSIGRQFKKGHLGIKPEGFGVGSKNSQYGKKGNKSANWKGGISPLTDRIRQILEYNQWRSDVFRRDYWTCQTCHRKGGGIIIQPHHIKSFSQIIKENNITTIIEAQLCKELWDTNNGVTLCRECHELTASYGRRVK